MVGARLRFQLRCALVTLAGISAAAAADYSPPAGHRPAAAGMLQQLVSARLCRRRHERHLRPRLPAGPGQFGNGFAFEHNSICRYVLHRRRRRLRMEQLAALRCHRRIPRPRRASTPSASTTSRPGIDTYEGYLKSWVFLANAFVDLGTWNCFTPFVGSGIGGAYITLADFADVNPHRRLRLRPQSEQMESRLGAACRRRLQRVARISRSISPTAISITARSPTRSIASAAAMRIPSSSSNLIRTTSCSACAGPAAKRAPPPPRYVYTPPPPVYRRRRSTQPPLHSRG